MKCEGKFISSHVSRLPTGFLVPSPLYSQYLVIKSPAIYRSLQTLTRRALLFDELPGITFKNFRTLDILHLVTFSLLKGKVKRKILEAEIQIKHLHFILFFIKEIILRGNKEIEKSLHKDCAPHH